MNNIIEKITPGEALVILHKLVESDKTLENRIVELATELIMQVDYEEVSEDVFSVLDSIDVQELWDNSGSNSYGYTSPEDMAMEMLEEELDPFYKEVFRLIELKMENEAMLYCMGILKGIYDFVYESNSEFKDWATDFPQECFGNILGEWKKKNKNKLNIKKMHKFIEKECEDWGKWAIIK